VKEGEGKNGKRGCQPLSFPPAISCPLSVLDCFSAPCALPALSTPRTPLPLPLPSPIHSSPRSISPAAPPLVSPTRIAPTSAPFPSLRATETHRSEPPARSGRSWAPVKKSDGRRRKRALFSSFSLEEDSPCSFFMPREPNYGRKPRQLASLRTALSAYVRAKRCVFTTTVKARFVRPSWDT
jgi:hypothetical protein